MGKNGNRDIGIYQALANLSAGQTYIYAKTDGTCYENLLFGLIVWLTTD